MKTTVLIPDPIFRQLKQRAAAVGQTLSALVAELLQRGLQESRGKAELPPLPSFHAGRLRVDVADREALYRAMDQG